MPFVPRDRMHDEAGGDTCTGVLTCRGVDRPLCTPRHDPCRRHASCCQASSSVCHSSSPARRRQSQGTPSAAAACSPWLYRAALAAGRRREAQRASPPPAARKTVNTRPTACVLLVHNVDTNKQHSCATYMYSNTENKQPLNLVVEYCRHFYRIHTHVILSEHERLR